MIVCQFYVRFEPELGFAFAFNDMDMFTFLFV